MAEVNDYPIPVNCETAHSDYSFFIHLIHFAACGIQVHSTSSNGVKVEIFAAHQYPAFHMTTEKHKFNNVRIYLFLVFFSRDYQITVPDGTNNACAVHVQLTVVLH